MVDGYIHAWILLRVAHLHSLALEIGTELLLFERLWHVPLPTIRPFILIHSSKARFHISYLIFYFRSSLWAPSLHIFLVLLSQQAKRTTQRARLCLPSQDEAIPHGEAWR